MKLKFKRQACQTSAVEAVVDCFKGQTNTAGINYRIDPGSDKQMTLNQNAGFKNADIALTDQQILENIQAIQRRQNLPQSNALVKTKVSPINLDIEMETGTGKTYCYIKTFFEMNQRYGWSKFIIVVPSIAIREGVYKSLEITAEHFLEIYGKKTKFFIYNSRQLHNLESFSSDAGINVMVINVQAFNARGKDNRRIYEELDDFQSRRPIDVIKANRPILILDEPQKMEGKKTLDSFKEFNPLMILRYSATHKTTHNKVHRLDALDAYNQKLVKKIAVRGISIKNLPGTNAYLYLESIEVSRQSPVARIEIEVKQTGGIKRITRKLKKGDNLFDLSDELDQYKGFVIADINAITDTVSFTNGIELTAISATLSEEELSFFDKQADIIVKAVLPPANTTPEIERNKKLITQNSEEQNNNEKKNSDQEQNDDLAIELRRSIKTVEVMGRIIKNRAGSLEKLRLESIFEEAMKIHLRILTSFFELIKHEEGQHEIVESISTKLSKIIENKREKRIKEGKKERMLGKDELEKISKTIFWNMNFFVVFGFIDKIIHSVGSNKLTAIIVMKWGQVYY